MAYSFVFYAGNGAQTDFVVPFPYIMRSHVAVYLAGVQQLSGWSWLDPVTVRFTVAPSLGTVILIRRRSSPGTKLVTFIDGSAATAADFNLDSLQDFYLAQEANDLGAATIALNDTLGAFDALGYRIVNVAAPAADGDAVNRLYLQQYVAGSGNVPMPLSPADNSKVLTANGGTFSWQSVAQAIQAIADLRIVSTDGSAAPGPVARLTRDSGSPLAGDALGAVNFEARNSAAAQWVAAQALATIVTPTAGAESGNLVFATMQGGVLAQRASIGAGFSVGGAVDPGAGKINVAGGYQVNSVALPCNKKYDSGYLAWSLGGIWTIPHGLGTRPTFIQCHARAGIANNGWPNGGELYIQPYADSDTGNQRGLSVFADATNLVVAFPMHGILAIVGSGTGAVFALSPVQWGFRIVAWAE